MGLRAIPRLRRQRERRGPAVRQAIDMVGSAIDSRAWSLTPAQYARFRDLLRRDAEPPALGEVESDETDQVWDWLTAGFGKPTVEAWFRVPGAVSTRPLPQPAD